ncbi:MAG: hypothetical protein KAX38_05855 [Candidatus Krumholzibacteria bacterium]|nr:hypothetical protein [Candidatus Krumholzibacteria bacterium]
MKKKHLRIAATVILAVIMVYSFGCILDPQEEPLPPDSKKTQYEPLTDKENVIKNLFLTYKHKEIEPYMELLHEEYYWLMQSADLEPGEQPMVVRQDDIKMTKGVFDNAVRLELEIYYASWQSVNEIGEEPCEDCWKTLRGYKITAQFNPEGTIYVGNDNVEFVVVPLTDGNGDPILIDGKKQYRLLIAADIK